MISQDADGFARNNARLLQCGFALQSVIIAGGDRGESLL